MSYSASLPVPLMIKASPRGSCRVGFPFQGATPWGRYATTTGSTNPWFVVRSVTGTPENPILRGGQPPAWGEHFLAPVGGPGEGQNQIEAGIFAEQHTGTPEGECVSSKWWTDKLYSEQKGWLSLWKHQESRVRNLLARLSGGPVNGFPSYLAQDAYDASFCAPVSVNWQLAQALPKALARFNALWPASRWTKQNFKTIECAKEIVSLMRWTDGGHTANRLKVLGKTGEQAVCSLQLSQAAPAVSGGTDVRNRWVSGRWIPDFAALAVVGGQLVPNSWLVALLDCLVPGWEKEKPAFVHALPIAAKPKPAVAKTLVTVVSSTLRRKAKR